MATHTVNLTDTTHAFITHTKLVRPKSDLPTGSYAYDIGCFRPRHRSMKLAKEPSNHYGQISGDF